MRIVDLLFRGNCDIIEVRKWKGNVLMDILSITSVSELKKIIADCKKRICEINPYGNLKEMSNKEFGEGWSEKYILSKVPLLKKDNSIGHDMFSEKYGRIEVKSARLPLTTITYNQCHPYECEYFLFVNYDTENGGEEIFFVPSKDILNEELFSKSKQHSRTEESCYTISGSTKKNKQSLTQYRFMTFSDLNNYLEV